MSETTQSKILLAMGVLGLFGTIGVQVMSVGALKGKFENVIETHAALIREHTIEIRSHDKSIERINGRMGLTSSSFQKWKETEEPVTQQQ